MSRYSHKALMSSLFQEDPKFLEDKATSAKGRVQRADYERLLRRVRFGPDDPPLHDMTPAQKIRFLNTYKSLELKFSARHRNFYIIPNFKPALTPAEKRRAERRAAIAEERQEREYQRKLKALGGVMNLSNFMPSREFPTYKSYIKGRYKARATKSRKSFKRKRHMFNKAIRLLELFVGLFVRCGNKVRAFKFFRSVVGKIRRSKYYKRNKRKLLSPTIAIFKAVRSIRPKIALRTKRVGSVVYRLPTPVMGFRRGSSMAIRWIFQVARSRPERSLSTAFAREIIDIHNDTGGALRKREDMYRIAYNNKPFMRYLKKKKKFKGVLKKIRP